MPDDDLPVVVVVDVFRASATACHVLARAPARYFLVSTCAAAHRLAELHPGSLLVGRPEPGNALRYQIPNSPTRVADEPVEGRVVIHRTAAAGSGILAVEPGARVFLAGFVNASATARQLHRAHRIQPMGHEGVTPSLEDDLGAACLRARLEGGSFDLEPHRGALRDGPGRYFFTGDPAFYPRQDFDHCLTIDAFDFAVRADVVGDYARLSRA